MLCAALPVSTAFSQNRWIDQANIRWDSQSRNSSESMPCGGGDIGLNVWVENGDILLYVSRSGTFDENNTLLKAGRVRLSLKPNPFTGENFRQELSVRNGQVIITGSNKGLSARAVVWVDVFQRAIHVTVSSNQAVETTAAYENWRYTDQPVRGKANNANSYKFAPQGEVITHRDDTDFEAEQVLFYHRNGGTPSAFDVTVRQQGMDTVKDQLFNPLKDLTFGGVMRGSGMVQAGIDSGRYDHTPFRAWNLRTKRPQKITTVDMYLHTANAPSLADWRNGLNKTVALASANTGQALAKSAAWWMERWNSSFIHINPDSANPASPAWQTGRNYQLMRYLLLCNAYGQYPTKFNGGLFTYDPFYVDSTYPFTPDFRNWGGGTHTAQNQRLVYFPLIKSGDAAFMKPQFDFYLRILRNAELRSQVYWKHGGASFTEQIENFGLPNPAEYAWKRPPGYDPGMEYNAWLEYEWDTVLEFCLMMLETERYAGHDIRGYIPFIESCLRFFDEHYQYLSGQRSARKLDANGHLVLYPGSGAETYKMAYNSSSTIAGLKTVLDRMLELPGDYLTPAQRTAWQHMQRRIPPISFAQFGGKPTIAPAKSWERINNVESPQLYPVFPWGVYGVGKPGLDTALNTWTYDTNVVRFRSHIGWKQDNIFAARLGLTKEAAALTTAKLGNSGRRFPAFWGPGFDWTPDHNWGGSGMIGLQEMLLQADGRKIMLLPAWPADWDVHFKLHAPYQTTVEGVVKGGKLQKLVVLPAERAKDVVVGIGF